MSANQTSDIRPQTLAEKCVQSSAPLMHGTKPYRWCDTHNRFMFTCEQERLSPSGLPIPDTQHPTPFLFDGTISQKRLDKLREQAWGDVILSRDPDELFGPGVDAEDENISAVMNRYVDLVIKEHRLLAADAKPCAECDAATHCQVVSHEKSLGTETTAYGLPVDAPLCDDCAKAWKPAEPAKPFPSDIRSSENRRLMEDADLILDCEKWLARNVHVLSGSVFSCDDLYTIFSAKYPNIAEPEFNAKLNARGFSRSKNSYGIDVWWHLGYVPDAQDASALLQRNTRSRIERFLRRALQMDLNPELPEGVTVAEAPNLMWGLRPGPEREGNMGYRIDGLGAPQDSLNVAAVETWLEKLESSVRYIRSQVSTPEEKK